MSHLTLVSRLAQTPPARRAPLLTEHLLARLREALSIDDDGTVKAHSRFAELGIDSKRALALKEDLEDELNASLPTTLFFDYPTAERLAAHVIASVLTFDDAPSDSGDATQASVAARSEPIAIVGMACRFPGAEDLDAYWKLLIEGRDAVTEAPAERWEIDDFYHPDPDAPGKMSTRRGGFIEDVDRFDAAFFNISPREAELMDPQQRLLLELTWAALEDAGIAPDRLERSDTGVFAGVTASDYARMAAADQANLNAYWGTGNAPSVIAGRIAYTFGLHGPCMSIDTACSSALVAIHNAVQNLRLGECGMALVVSSNLVLAPEATIAFSKARMLSSDGRCQSFDERANGYVRSEGAAALVLKPLSRAHADGDRVHAIIRATAINQDGASSGLTVPNGPAQGALIRRALDDGRIDPAEIGYIEAHGTGTSLGDPIEVEALGEVFRDTHSTAHPLHIGSVKSLIGHLELAAGMAGLIKLVLSLKRGVIPGYPQLGELNKHIHWDTLPLTVAREPVPWPSERRMGGVSSFGFSGTNAHVVVEPPSNANDDHTSLAASDGRIAQPAHLLCLSARSERALATLAQRYARYLEEAHELDIDALCHTAATCRMHLPHRLAVAGASVPDLAERLRAMDTAALRQASATVRVDKPIVAFAFSGQGAQYAGMARQLDALHPIFRAALDECASALAPEIDVPLRELLWGHAAAALSQTRYTQPALFAVEYALARLWQSWGIEPDLVIGHSIGEFAAACVAGVFSVADAARLVAARGRLMQQLPEGGAMAALAAPRELVASAIAGREDRLSIAAFNAPMQTVISGHREDVLEIGLHLHEAHGIAEPSLLDVSHAFHSPLMQPMLRAFEQVAASVAYERPSIGFISTVTGSDASDTVSGPDYWVKHVVAPVDFMTGAATLAQQGASIVLEIGPGTTLAALARACPMPRPMKTLASLRRGRDDWHAMLDALGQLYLAGATIDWQRAGRLDQPPSRRIALPGYPFERTRHWFATHAANPAGLATHAVMSSTAQSAHALLGAPVRTAAIGNDDALFQSVLPTRNPALLRDHRVYGKVVVPGAAYIEMMLSAARAQHADAAITLVDLSIQTALVLAHNRPALVQTLLRREADRSQSALRVMSVPADMSQSTPSEWRLHISATLEAAVPAGSHDAPAAETAELSILRARFTESGEPIDVDAFYARNAMMGLDYGPIFRSVRTLARIASTGESLAQVVVDARAQGTYVVHPALLDGCFQAVGAIVPDLSRGIAYLPVAIERLSVGDTLGGEVWSHAVLRASPSNETRVTADIRLFDSHGRIVATVTGLQAVPVDRRTLTLAVAEWKNKLYGRNWMVRPRSASSSRASPSATRGRWLLVGGRGQRAAQLTQSLTANDQYVDLVDSDSAQNMTQGDWRQLIATRSASSEAPLRGVIDLSAADFQDSEHPDAFLQSAARASAGPLALAQALVSAPASQPIRFWFVTTGAQAVDGQGPTSAVPATLWGMARTIALECPALACTCIDLAPNEPALPPELVAEFLAPEPESQIAYRRGRRYVARLAAMKSLPRTHELARPEGAFRLRATQYGAFDRLALAPFERKPPADHEVEIEVDAAAVNFKDVLFSLGMLREFSERAGIGAAADQPLGFECAGRIVRLGRKAQEQWRIGEAVVAMAHSAMASHVTADARLVRRKPAAIGFEAAAALPTVFMTAIHSLERLAKIQPGERVLIHACAGGVGQAALQIAQKAGAVVYGTASPSKWKLLERQGVAHLMNSRSLEFADELIRVTEGRGVDVVINSLSGAFIEKSADVLAPGGRFIEIGKIGIWSAAQMAAHRPDIAYHAFDLGELDEAGIARQAALMDEVMRRVDAGTLEPLPIKVFPIDRADAAFRYLAQANNIGKVVLKIDLPRERSASPVRGDRTYLVTGGFGALGREVAKRLVEQGARHVVLAGRHPDDAVTRSIAADAAAANIQGWQIDVADAASVASVIGRIKDELPPLGGIVHAAGLLEDATLQNQSWPQFERVLSAKAAGAWHLHHATEHMKLDFFVLFSSIASVFGAPGQASYAAANASLDALAHYRHAQGLSAISINWGPWDAGGMAERARAANETRFAAVGLGRQSAAECLEVLSCALDSDVAQLVVADIAWERFLHAIAHSGTASFYELVKRPAAEGGATGGKLLARLESTAAEGRLALLTDALRSLIAGVVGLASPDMVDAGTPLRALGIDSLMAVELKNKLEEALRCVLSPTLLIDYPTINDLSAHLLDSAFRTSAAEPARATALPVSADGSFASLSDSVIEVDRRHIGICSWGSDASAPLVVCVHGMLDQAAIWNDVARDLTERGLRVLAPDLRGHGRSSHAPPGSSLTVLDFVADLRDALEREGNARTLMLVGHSTGAAVSALYTALNPERVSHLVMIEPIAPTLRDTRDPLARLAGDLRYMSAAPAHPVYPDIATAARMLAANHPKLDDAAARVLASRITHEVPGGVSWTWDARMRNQFGIDLSLGFDEYVAVLNTLRAPLLRLYGRSSEFANTPALLSPDVRLPKSDVVFLDGSHNLHTDAASAVAQRVAAHFDIPAEGRSHAP